MNTLTIAQNTDGTIGLMTVGKIEIVGIIATGGTIEMIGMITTGDNDSDQSLARLA